MSLTDAQRLGMTSSNSDEWATPQWLFDQLDEEFSFTLDPCAKATTAKCERFFTEADDGLAQDWGREVVFMNPPYGRGIARWVRKAYESALAGATVVCLIPARTDTSWWHTYCGRMSQLKLALSYHPETCHHLGDLYRYDRLVASGDIEPHPDVPGDGFGYTVCGDCGAVFTAKEMLNSGIWPAIPA